MANAQANNAIEEIVIDESFKNVASPVEIHRLGREDIVENRPGDVLVNAVKEFSAKGGFVRAEEAEILDGVKVSQDAAGRVDLEIAKDIAAGVNHDAATTEIKE
jgi:hypothetical protein